MIQISQYARQLFVSCYNSNGVYASILIRIHGDQAEMHHVVHKWGKDILLDLLDDFNQVKVYLRERGVKQLYTYSRKYDTKMGRYWNYFNFEIRGERECNKKAYTYAAQEI